ncbi:cysteine--tRNA ligase [Iodidimonas nitroreducens]|uniref:Cysteine--tRNA ligase n=1 Tax=Iodidimonas nitroreducens TaxID=1236968 RepID=A0A5A7N963_9PROT|nr:cysteine--tRNA ligase [Iodidimonas nitroreducens]GAK32270.1 cysteine--tRNA ligase [alpha proteobacterium Q-1]GER04881.1 cysteine--tRNA ligase [Iodidimonas nitroreducens]
MSLVLTNSMSGRKETFKPIDAANVRMYVCGPTVYDHAHIGNARPPVVFDLLYRLLGHLYGAAHVTYARNITDIDDKIIARAQESGRDIADITDHYTRIYREDMAQLNILPPDIEPLATDHIEPMIAMIKALIEKQVAYAAEGHVLFHVPAMPDYGKLSHRPRDEMVAGARVEVAPYKKDPADFILWKPSSPNQPGWDSPWGRGRPGWHLECSAMIKAHLGTEIDLHGGGQDLIFPHHENEMAQSECAHDHPFVRTWVHNGYVLANGEKMSKSLGNFHTVHDLLADFPGEAIRLTLMSAHYRQPLDFTKDGIAENRRRLDRWYRLIGGVEAAKSLPQTVITALEDDLNSPKAIAALEALAKPETADQLLAGAQFMGLLLEAPDVWFKAERSGGLDQQAVEALIVERRAARQARDFARADAVRDQLDAAGIRLLDRPDGTTDWERIGHD